MNNDDPIKNFEQKLLKEKQEKQEKGTGKFEKTEAGTASPVIEKSKGLKLWMSRTFFVVAAIFFLIIIYNSFTGGDKSKKSAAKDTGANEQVEAPTVQAQDSSHNGLSLNNQQIEKLKKAVFNQDERAQQEAMLQAAKAAEMRMSAPSNVIANDSASNNTLSSNAKNNAVLGGDGTGDANTAFMAKVSDSSAPTAKATHIAHLSTTLAQGNVIQATLESNIASDLPGMLRAVTSSDIYSEDQSTLLIPRGSRLIGQYTNRVQQGQNRVFVVWQRLIRPDGIDVQIASPGTDTLGSAGLAADSIDHHFLQQFGTAVLLSVIGAGASNFGVSSNDQYNSASAYRQAIAGSFNQEAQQTLQNTGVIPPTLYVNQGTKITVFIARDLDFYDALNSENQKNAQSTGSLFEGNLN